MMFLRYLKSKWRLAVMLAVFAGVFAGVFYLYRLPVRTVLYASLICLFVGCVFAVVDYLSFLRKYTMIRDYTASQNDVRALPEPRTLLDVAYDDALRAAAQVRRDEIMKLGRAADEQTGYFTMWAHQIKVPISAMRLILQGEDTKTSRELEAQLFMTEQYVQMVLAYLRSGSESTDYVFRDCRLDRLVCASLRRFAPMFIRKKLALDFTESGLSVLTDEKWLSFAFEQVLSNAIKYTSSGSVTVSAELSENAHGGNEVVLSVADTGCGIAAEDLPRVFENSYTGYNGRSDLHATGLGLYLTRQVLDRLGHRISVSSEPGQGTTVRIYLPASSAVQCD